MVSLESFDKSIQFGRYLRVAPLETEKIKTSFAFEMKKQLPEFRVDFSFRKGNPTEEMKPSLSTRSRATYPTNTNALNEMLKRVQHDKKKHVIPNLFRNLESANDNKLTAFVLILLFARMTE